MTRRRQGPPRPAPLSLRLSDAERASLTARAGSVPLSTYVKQVLFADGGSSLRRVPRRVSVDGAKLAQVLAYLGSSQLARSLSTLAEAAASGSLFVDELTIRRLHDACGDVQAMHVLLLGALGKKVPSRAPHKQRLSVKFQRSANPGADR